MSRLRLITTALIALGTTQLLLADAFQFNYSDTLPVNGATLYPTSNTKDVTTFAQGTPISVTATFDSSNLDTAQMYTPPGASEPLFTAYIPTHATLTIGGQTYTIDESGVKTDIVLFDQTTPLSQFITDMKGHYGVGMIQGVAPGGSDSGFIADFLSATTKITENGGIVPTTFTDYQGSGFTPGPGVPDGCTNHNVITCTSFNVAPFPLIGSDGKSYDIVFGTWHDDSFYNLPGTNDTTVAADVSFAAIASDAPEPSALYMAFGGLALLAAGAGLKKRLS